jgi:hypothetical protein
MTSDFERRLRSDLPRLADEIAREPVDDVLGADLDAASTPIADVVDERATARRRLPAVGLVVAIAVIAAALAIPLSLQARDHGARRTDDTKAPHGPKVVVDGPGRYEKIVAAAASNTAATGSYKVQFHTQEHPSPEAPDCETVEVQGIDDAFGGDEFFGRTPGPTSGTVCVPRVHDVTTSGVAIVNTTPFAMRAESNVSNLGDVTVVVGPNAIWEFGGANYGSDGEDAGPGAPLAEFAGLVEGTLGQREGGLAMTSLASPNGYLNLTTNAITDATPLGSGVVDGVPVQNYRVTIDIHALTTAAAITADEVKAINDAIAVLRQEGYTGTTQEVSVDADGLIRRTKSTATFGDGGTVVSENTFSQFGCAGIVGLPGSGAPSLTPQTCAPPAPATTAPTTTVPTPTTTTVQAATTTTTTTATAPAATTTVPVATTTTGP